MENSREKYTYIHTGTYTGIPKVVRQTDIYYTEMCTVHVCVCFRVFSTCAKVPVLVRVKSLQSREIPAATDWTCTRINYMYQFYMCTNFTCTKYYMYRYIHMTCSYYSIQVRLTTR